MYRRAGYIEDIPEIFVCAGLAKGQKDSCEVSFAMHFSYKCKFILCYKVNYLYKTLLIACAFQIIRFVANMQLYFFCFIKSEKQAVAIKMQMTFKNKLTNMHYLSI